MRNTGINGDTTAGGWARGWTQGLNQVATVADSLDDLARAEAAALGLSCLCDRGDRSDDHLSTGAAINDTAQNRAAKRTGLNRAGVENRGSQGQTKGDTRFDPGNRHDPRSLSLFWGLRELLESTSTQPSVEARQVLQDF